MDTEKYIKKTVHFILENFSMEKLQELADI